MKIAVIFLIVLIRFSNCLNYSTEHVDVVLFGQSVNDQTRVKISEVGEILKHETFNPKLKTVFIVPGIPANIDNAHFITFIQSYINSKRYNIIYFDGSYYLNYVSQPGLLDILPRFGELYGSAISKLITFGLSVDSIELVSHSVGSGLAYMTATNTIPKLPLLIGLDPSNMHDFRKGSTDYTIALHTNIGQAGQLHYNTSDTDLIANDGVFQPMCTDRQDPQEIESVRELYSLADCSHIAALYYWGSMIENPKLFYGVECNEIFCNYKNVRHLGPNLRAPGAYYFRTSKTSPYGLGLDGIRNVTPMNQNVMNALQLWLPLWDLILLCKNGYCSSQQKQELIDLLNLN